MAAVHIIDNKTLSEKEYPLRCITFEMPDRQGKMVQQEHEVYDRPDAVTVLIADRGTQKFLLTKQFRLPTFLNGNDAGYLVETCAGLIDENETPEQAARREVEEETGYAITGLRKVAGAYTSAGAMTEFLHLFIATYDSDGKRESGGGLEEEGEDIALVEMGFEEAKNKLLKGEFRDAKTIMLLQHYFLEDLNEI
jgi:nudix-type nucleoside diphosphatase (YffH/AdpP family)